ncbi:MAG: NUDIX domain-containing protein [Calditrichaeota bacterium]|nr:MAG: NUDIX domain-containing protein [Calditrichota bacterium]
MNKAAAPSRSVVSRRDLIRLTLLGFLPLLVFVLADALWGLSAGLVVALVFGLGQLGWTFLRQRRLDGFVLLDTGLIVLLGSISLWFHNDLFFKLKPALVEAILAVLLALSAFGRRPLLIQMSLRHMPDFRPAPEQLQQMKRTMRQMLWVVLLHIGMVIYAAFYLSTEAWGFVSGGLFYLLLGGVVAGQAGRALWQRRKLKGEEWFPIVDPQGKVTGMAPRSQVHGNPALIHPVVHLHIFNRQGELYLQKRAENKDLYPGKWDTAVGGHVRAGETIEQALRREAEEELGITLQRFRPLFRYIHRNERESELVHGFLLVDDGPFYPDPLEIQEGRFWRIAEIQALLGKGIFTPNFEQEFVLLQQLVLPRLRMWMAEFEEK